MVSKLFQQINRAYKIQLVSRSPRRKRILRELGFNFRVVLPKKEVPEKIRNRHILKDIRQVTLNKLNSVPTGPGKISIACDTIVVYNFKVFGKPRQKSKAYAYLTALSGRKHDVYSCLAIKVHNQQGIRIFQTVEKTAVFFRKLDNTEIAEYINSSEPYDKAGGYGIQAQGMTFIKKIHGCYYNVVGLPIYGLIKLLKQLKGAK